MSVGTVINPFLSGMDLRKDIITVKKKERSFCVMQAIDWPLHVRGASKEIETGKIFYN